MTTISDSDRAEAQAMADAFYGCGLVRVLSDDDVRRWLAVRDHVLAAHECPDVESDPRVRAWDIIAKHPIFFADCYSTDGALVDAMLAKLDAARNHTCEPEWRPTTFDEIQVGWEVRSRRSTGTEAGWGVAGHRDTDGDWRTEAGGLLTYASRRWTYETTAPPPEPEPWDEALVEDVVGAIDHYDGFSDHALARSLLSLLAERGLIERPGGEQLSGP